MVRDAAAEALGTMLKVVGERTMGVFLDGVDDIKMAKVRIPVRMYMWLIQVLRTLHIRTCTYVCTHSTFIRTYICTYVRIYRVHT